MPEEKDTQTEQKDQKDSKDSKDTSTESKDTQETKDASETTETESTETTEETGDLSEEKVASLKESITKDVSSTVSDKVSKSVIEKIGDALGLSKKEEEALPESPEELKKVIQKNVKSEMDKLSTRMDEDRSKSEKERQTKIDGIITGWHAQYNQLASLGKVPVVKDAKSQTDEGVVARKKIILAIGKMIEKNKADGSDYTPSVSDVLVTSPNVLSEVPGADLPISGNTSVVEDSANFSNKEISGKSFAEIAAGNAS